MWGNECNVFLQTLHFSLGFGSIFAPIMVRPFLTSDTLPMSSESPFPIQPLYSRIGHAFQYMSFLIAVIFVGCCIVLMVWPQNPVHSSRANNEELRTDLSESVGQITLIMSIILGTLYIHLVYGVEIAFGLLLPAYAVKSDFRLSKQVASSLSTLYWCAFSVCRLCNIVAATICKPVQVLRISSLLLVLSSLLLLGPARQFVACLWFAVALTGLGNNYPSISAIRN